MRYRLKRTAIAVALAFAAPQAANALEKIVADLLKSARIWEGKNQGDLARANLEKLLVAYPATPEARLLLGDIELKAGNSGQAEKQLAILQQNFPKHPATLQLAELFRVYTQHKQDLAKARLLSKSGKTAEAKEIWLRLFPVSPPGGQLALEYYQSFSGAAEDRKTARAGLLKLYRATDDSRYLLAAASLHGDSDEEIAAAVKNFEKVAESGEANPLLLRQNWRRALLKMPTGDATMPYLRTFLRHYPEDEPVIDRLKEELATREARLRYANDPGIKALHAAVQAMADKDTALAEELLKEAVSRRPGDPEVLGNLGLLRLRQGKHTEAETLFTRADQLTPGGAASWRSLRSTAQFWKWRKEAESAIEQGDAQKAIVLATQMLTRQPGQTDALLLLASANKSAGHAAEAERVFSEVLQMQPDNSPAWRGLLAIYQEGGRREAAVKLLKQRLNMKESAREAARIYADLLKKEADLLLAARKTSAAMSVLEEVVAIDPADSWTRYDLARLYLGFGLDEPAIGVMHEGLAVDGKSSGMRHAAALILASLDKFEEAILVLAPAIGPAGEPKKLDDLLNKLVIAHYLQQASQMNARGDYPEAERLLLIAEAKARSDEQCYSMATTWMDFQLPDKGVTSFQYCLSRQAAESSPARDLLHAQLLNRGRKDEQLAPLLARLLQYPTWTPSDQAELLDIQTALAQRHIEGLRASQNLEQAIDIARQSIADSGKGKAYAKASARLLLAAGDYGTAIQILEPLVKEEPEELELRFDLALALVRAGHPAEAEMQNLARMIDTADINTRLREIKIWDELGKAGPAEAKFRALQNDFPQQPDVMLAWGRHLRGSGKYAEALSVLKKATSLEKLAANRHFPPQARDDSRSRYAGSTLKLAWSLADASVMNDSLPPLLGDFGLPEFKLAQELSAVGEPGEKLQLTALEKARRSGQPPLSSSAEREIASIETRRNPRFETGISYLSRHSDDGKASIRGIEIPNVAWIPAGYDGHIFIHADHVALDAGRLPADPNAADKFGKNLALSHVLNEPASQRASGMNFAVGFEGDRVRADIGVIGQGMPVSNVVGGFRFSKYTATDGYSIEGARRPVTSSLLSYAGTRDTASGEAWGGVTNTALSGKYQKSWGPITIFASGEYGLLRGKNVQENHRRVLRLGSDRDFVKNEDQLVNAGVTLTHMHYARNLSEYTFGHGGYYSPQSYLAVGFPVEWSGRSGRFSFQIKGNLSFSRSSIKNSPYYPTNTALQQSSPLEHEGGSGSGVGTSLRLASEYRLNERVAIGGKIEIDRSAYYTPNYALLYLRYSFDGKSGKEAFPPTALKPYSQF